MDSSVTTRTELAFRPLQPEDAPAIAKLEAGLHEADRCDGAENIRLYLENAESEDSNFSVGIFSEEQLVGYILCLECVYSEFSEFAGEQVIYLEDAAVLPAYRRHFYRLICTLLTRLREKLPGVSVEAHSLEPVLALWKRHKALFRDNGYVLTHTEKTGEQVGGVDQNRIHWTALDRESVTDARHTPLIDRLKGSQYVLGGQNYSVRLLDQEKDWQDLENFWDDYLFETPDGGGFQSYDYQRLWWKHFGSNSDLFILLVYRDRQLLGMAPFQITDIRIWSRNLKQLAFIGTRWEVDCPVLIFPQDAQACVEALVSFLMEHRKRWDLADFHEQKEGPVFRALKRELSAQGCFIGELEDSPCPYINFAEEKDWETFIAGKSQKFRKNLKAAQNKLGKEGKLEYRVYTERAQVEEQLEIYRELESRSWKVAEGVNIGKTDDYFRFHKELAGSFSEKGRYVIRMLTLDDQPVAGTFGLLVNGVFWSLHIVHDERWNKASPGTYLESLEIRDCFEDGVREYEFLGGFLNNKERWTRNFRESSEILIYQRKGILPLVYLAYFVVKPQLKKLRARLRSTRKAAKARLTASAPPARFVAPLPLKALRNTVSVPEDHIKDYFPFSADRVRYTFSATAGLFQAVNALGMEEGKTILVPSYNCGHEVEPLIRAGFKVSAYRIDAEMKADLDDLAARIDDSVAAVLLTHYFGMPQAVAKVRALCDDKDIFLIEDCAHALFSDNRENTLGRLGDVSVFSLRKTFPIPNGGAVVLNNPAAEFVDEPEPASPYSAWQKMLDLSKKSLLDGGSGYPRAVELLLLPPVFLLLFVCNWLARLNLPARPAWFNPDDEDFDFEDGVLYWEMSPSSQKILESQSPKKVIQKRQDNFRYLTKKLNATPFCQPVFQGLPKGACPLYFPVRVYNRDTVLYRLHLKKVFACPWWEDFHYATHWDSFPEAVSLKDRVIALPVHQDIETHHLDAMVDALMNDQLW